MHTKTESTRTDIDPYKTAGSSPPSELNDDANPYAAIPAELKERPQWVTWGYESRDSGKPAKRLYDPKTGLPASHSTPDTWGTFDQAVAALAADATARGIGYVFAPEDPYTGIDLDYCRDPITGEIDPDAQAIVEQFQSYTEISPSGTGLHILVKGKLPGAGRSVATQWANGRHGKIELYDQRRYFTVTGDHLPGTPTTIEPRQADVTALYQRLAQADPDQAPTRLANSLPPTNLADDDTLLSKARTAKDGAKFCRLFDQGDTSEYGGDHSAADQALCNLLAFWSGDADQMDGLFRRSALMRDKWDEKRGEQTYGELTITKALLFVPNRYDGESSDQPSGATTEPQTPPPVADRYTLYTAQQMIALPEPPFLIQGVLPSQALAALVGDYASYKTFVALDMALSIAGSRPWLGHTVEPGPALYISAEGSARLGRRIQAWQFGRGCPLPRTAYFLPQAVQLIKDDEITRLLNSIAALPQSPVFVVIDTLARSMVGYDENANRDMGQFVAAAERIQQATGATVFILHHLTKGSNNTAKTVRGGGSLPAALDTIMEIAATGDTATVKCTKEKDAACFESIQLRKRVVPLPYDPRFPGDRTSLVLDLDKSPQPRKAVRADDNAAKALAILVEQFGATGATNAQWLAACFAAGIPASTYYRVKRELVAAGSVVQPTQGKGTKFYPAGPSTVALAS